jgi:hypothetical protein
MSDHPMSAHGRAKGRCGDLADGSVSSFNMSLWLGLLAVVAAVVGGGWMLDANGKRGGAIAVLLILAVPGVLYALFILLIVIAQPRWN